MSKIKIMTTVVLLTSSIGAHTHEAYDCRDKVISENTIWYGEATCAHIDPVLQISCDAITVDILSSGQPTAIVNAVTTCHDELNDTWFEASMECEAEIPNSRTEREVQSICTTQHYHENNFLMNPGVTHNHQGNSYSVSLKASLWDSYGPITRRFGTLYKTSPNGSIRAISFNQIIQEHMVYFTGDATGQYRYRVKVCHEYMNDPSTNQCRTTGYMTMNVTN